MEQLAPQPSKYCTVDEYLRLEADSVDKHEYRNGEIVAMAGGTARHSLITANVIREMGNSLKRKACRVYDSNLRVLIPQTGLYTYPDAVVVCGPPQFDPKDAKQTTLLNPRVIVEVLSSGTEDYDQASKFNQYLTIESFREYVVVFQNQPRVERRLQQANGSWLLTFTTGLETAVPIQSVEIELPLSEVYAGVEFTTEPPIETSM